MVFLVNKFNQVKLIILNLFKYGNCFLKKNKFVLFL